MRDSTIALPVVVQAVADDDSAFVDVSDADGSRLLDLPYEPWAPSWTGLTAHRTSLTSPRATAPRAEFRVNGLIFSTTIEDHVRPIVEPYGEILPMTVERDPFHLFHCLNTADALDEENSGLLDWDPGIEPRRLGFYLDLALKEDVAAEAGIFQLPERPGTIFYARQIAERLLAVPGWTGTTFRAPY